MYNRFIFKIDVSRTAHNKRDRTGCRRARIISHHIIDGVFIQISSGPRFTGCCGENARRGGGGRDDTVFPRLPANALQSYTRATPEGRGRTVPVRTGLFYPTSVHVILGGRDRVNVPDGCTRRTYNSSGRSGRGGTRGGGDRFWVNRNFTFPVLALGFENNVRGQTHCSSALAFDLQNSLNPGSKCIRGDAAGDGLPAIEF